MASSASSLYVSIPYVKGGLFCAYIFQRFEPISGGKRDSARLPSCVERGYCLSGALLRTELKMGNSACCGFDGEDKTNVTLQQLATAGLKEVSPQVYEGWVNKYKEGGSVQVLFPDGQRIECKLMLDSSKKILNLSFKEKIRLIPYKDIESCIYGSTAVEQNSADAKLLRDPRVVGFRLFTSGRAIAVSFDDLDAAICFVRFLEQILEESRNGEDHPNPSK